MAEAARSSPLVVGLSVMRTFYRGAFLAIVLLVGVDVDSSAQSPEGKPGAESIPFCEDASVRTSSLDTRGLGGVYCATNAAVARPLHWAHVSARPVFYSAVPVAWATGFLREPREFADAYRLTLTQGVAYGLVYGLKRAVGRPRPYVTRALVPRSSRHPVPGGDRYTSFPSGHAALSAALVTSWGLSHPRWYVLGPGVVWAVGVSLSRVHLGVHYPSDIVVGMAIGVGVGILVHHFGDRVTPTRFRAEASISSLTPLPFAIRVQM